jgi:hypothetical protein
MATKRLRASQQDDQRLRASGATGLDELELAIE